MPIRTIVTVIGLALAGVSALVDAGESSADAISSTPRRAATAPPPGVGFAPAPRLSLLTEGVPPGELDEPYETAVW